MSQHFAAAGPWSPPQMIRLENEWRRLQRSFAYHPLVQIIPLTGDPPAEYQVQYKVTTLAINADGQLAYINTCAVHIWLPPQYPHAAPVVRPLSAIFHPNVGAEWIYLGWNPNMTLAQLVTQVGQLLAYQNWDVNGIANPAAIDWVSENQHLVPTDPTANFGADADGEPLGRIIRYGAQTVEQIRARLEEMLKRIVSTAPPMQNEVQRFGEQTRLALSLFSDTDVPEHLKSAADELDELALSLATIDSPWFILGRRFGAAQAAVDGANAMREAIQTLNTAETSFEKLEPGPPVEGKSPVQTLLSLPPPDALQAAVMNMRKVLKSAEQRLATLRDRSGALETAPAVLPQGTAGLFYADRFAADITRVDQALVIGRDMSAGAIAEARPAIARAASILSAMERILEWAEYADLLNRGHAMVDQAVNVGAAAIQAFFLVDAEGENGPFQYEHRLDPFGARIAVSNIVTTSIDVLDTRSGQLIGHGDGGDVTVTLPGTSEAPAQITIHPTDHTEELRVPIEYLVTETRERFAKLMQRETPAETAETWAFRHDAVLSESSAMQQIQEEHRARRQIWKGLLLDLVAVGRYKQRLATYGQLERAEELVPRIKAEAEKLEALLKTARERIAYIVQRSGRDLETEAPIIPSKFGEEYRQRADEREKAKRHLPRLQKLMSLAAEQIRRRWSNPRLIGTGGTPAFYILPPVPTELSELDPLISNANVVQQVTALEELLGVSLKPEELTLPQEASGGAPLASTGAGAVAEEMGTGDLGVTPSDLMPAEGEEGSTEHSAAALEDASETEPTEEITPTGAQEQYAGAEEFVSEEEPAPAAEGDWFVVSDDEAQAAEEER